MFGALNMVIFSSFFQLPLLLVYIVGFALALGRRKILGRAASLAAAGFGFEILNRVGSVVVVFLQVTARSRGAAMMDQLQIVSLMSTGLQAIAFIAALLIVMAVLARRPA